MNPEGSKRVGEMIAAGVVLMMGATILVIWFVALVKFLQWAW